MKFIHRMKISGKGPFPMDMLRYDRCWPVTQGDVYMLESAHGEEWSGEIGRYSDSKDVTFTTGRWASFGVVCGEVRTEKMK